MEQNKLLRGQVTWTNGRFNDNINKKDSIIDGLIKQLRARDDQILVLETRENVRKEICKSPKDLLENEVVALKMQVIKICFKLQKI